MKPVRRCTVQVSWTTGSSIWWVSVLKFKSEYSSSAAVTWPLLSEHTTTKTCIYCMNILHSLKSADWFELCRVAGNPVLADRSDRQTGPPAASVPPQQSRVLHCSGSAMRRLLTVSARRRAPRWARTDRTDRPHRPTDRPHRPTARTDRTDRPHRPTARTDRTGTAGSSQHHNRITGAPRQSCCTEGVR